MTRLSSAAKVQPDLILIDFSKTFDNDNHNENAILSVLCILEEDSHQFQWKLSRNKDGLSLQLRHYIFRQRAAKHTQSTHRHKFQNFPPV